MSAEFTLEEFAKQLRQLRGLKVRTDPLSELADYFREGREETLARVERILAAVRPEERAEPNPVGPSERARIAAESGVAPADVDRFFAGVERLRVRMRELAGMGFFQRLRVAFGGAGVVVLPWVLVVGLLVARLAGW